MDSEHPLVFFDGTCGLCDGFVQFVLARDRAERFRFTPLQGELARGTLSRFGVDAASLQTVYVLERPGAAGERLLGRSDAVLFVISQLPAPWRWGAAARVVPRALRDAVYAVVAKHRSRVFGRTEACRLPSPSERARFL